MTASPEAPRSRLLLSVIIPVYNEIDTIGEILTRVRRQRVDNVDIEMLVVDDGSTDGTGRFLEANPDLYDVLLTNPRNLGKGGAIKHGLTRASGAYILFQDGDLEYDPDDYRDLLAPVMKYDADVVMGSRFLAPKWTRVSYFWHKLGNKLLTAWFDLLYNTTWTDVYSCYLLFRSDLLRPDELRTMRWQQQAEILGKICLRARRLYEVPITYAGRSYDEGKKLPWHSFIGVTLTMLRVRVFH